MRTVAIITARWQSTRLPGKMLADINGKPMLQWVVDQCRKSKVDEVVVATTLSSWPIIDYCYAHDILFTIGDEEDIVSRLYNAGVAAQADVIIRVWGDSPMVAPSIINELLEFPGVYAYKDLGAKGTGAARLTFDKLKHDYKTLTGDDRHWYHKYCWPDYSVDDEQSLARVRSILV
ncbi:MAG: NTP transferase domain-containing protein [Planctomycetes bacterium]|nr:NTP transferase domain-containing protein [Thermoplasmata archaeon]MBE3143546.1 NTP transferase domain-containing protein [Planctomycetota bacterium]